MPGEDLEVDVRYLHSKQGLDGDSLEYVTCYNKETDHMLRRRLTLISDPGEVKLIRKHHPVVTLRPQLGPKKDARRKMRLLLQGFKEPDGWDIESNASPVAKLSTIRSLVYRAGSKSEVLSIIDVSVAFLQSDLYGPSDMKRYVSLRSHPGSPVHVFELRGPIYGQRSAPRAWNKTLTKWLTDPECSVDGGGGDTDGGDVAATDGEIEWSEGRGMGYVQARNDPCLFTHPITGHQLVIWVDDILCRGTVADSVDFYNRLGSRFDCKDPEFLESGSSICFTGIEISRRQLGGEDWYYLSQLSDLQEFMHDSGLIGCPEKPCPMPERLVMVSDSGALSEGESSWCRSVISALNYLARVYRWDIAHATSRLSQYMKQPISGTVAALEYLGGYLASTSGMRVAGCRVEGPDSYEVYVDSDHHGDAAVSTRSHTGVTVLLNGTPVFWRSNKQIVTALSPAEAEIYAFSEGVRDAKDIAWVLEEMGCEIKWPLQVKTDSGGAHSFQRDSCPKSKIRGVFDRRDKWVVVMQDTSVIESVKIDTKVNKANIHTKCLKNKDFNEERNYIIRGQGIVM